MGAPWARQADGSQGPRPRRPDGSPLADACGLFYTIPHAHPGPCLMPRLVLATLAVLAMTHLPATAEDPLPLDKLVYEDGDTKLPYRLLKPATVETGRRCPLVIFLHGAGERGTDNEKQLVHGIPQFVLNRDKFPCFLIAPQCPDGKRWVEVDWSADSHTQPKEPGE